MADMSREQFEQIKVSLGDDWEMIGNIIQVLFDGQGTCVQIAAKLGIDIGEAERLLNLAYKNGLVE